MIKKKSFFKTTSLLLMFAFLGIFVTACVPKEMELVPPEEELGTASQEEALIEVVIANNEFALDLYQRYQAQEEGNIFFSPYSISSALAMTYEGARGETAEEMRSVFHFPESEEYLRSGYQSLNQVINQEDKDYQLRVANALWAEEDFEFLTEYFNLVNRYYGAEITNLDFKNNAEESRLTINDWVGEQTEDKIKDLIPAGAINPLTRLILTNAIYFKGNWLQEFDQDQTTERDFKVSESEVVRAEMMQRTDEEAEFNYLENEQLQILELPYQGEELSMLIFLPQGNDIDALGDTLIVEKIEEWKEELREQRVKVYLPKFKFETKYFMKKDLSDLGMSSAFSNLADFSGMTGEKDLFISEVIHQAFVDVNEEGTEAAAATAVVMELLSAGPGSKIPVFRADHPFIFMIQQKDSGNILFLGRVMNPNQE
ncbi:serpin family protein [Patescibacteria group bacterium]|nr:serpin family protein [Patescibacteria group bacterium]